MFERFTSRITIRGAIIAETGLHIGKGGSSLDPSATDSPVMRDAAGKPFIPGSSFKGAFRAHLESLLRGLALSHLNSCDPFAEPCLTDDKIKKMKSAAEEAAKENHKINQAKKDELFTNAIVDEACCICKLCGSPYLASRLMIKDLFIDDWFGRVELRDGVGIDRDSETARQGVKYDFEVIPASTQFKLEMDLENGDLCAFGLLFVGLREMEQGRIALGGKTTRGLGGVRLELDEIEVVGDADVAEFDSEKAAELLNYLINGKGKILKGSEMRAFLKKKTDNFARDILNNKE